MFALAVYSQNETTTVVKSPIKSVVAYLDGAEISHSLSVKLVAGRNIVVFSDISSALVQKSISVTTDESISVLAISSKLNNLTKMEEKPRIKQLKDSLKLIQSKVSAITDELDALKTEKEMLLKNTAIGGTNNGVSINDLKLAADYYRSRVTEINGRVSKITLQNEEFTATLNDLNSELDELNATLSYKRNEISILLNCAKDVTTEITLQYLVNSAGWVPSYDIKATEINKPVTLVYRAKVYNNTGVDWQNVNIKLSTADPTQSLTKPELKPWYLNFNSNSMGEYSYQKNDRGSNMQVQQSNAFQEYNSSDNSLSSDMQEVELDELGAEFEIKTKYSIPADAKPYLVDVTEYQLPATYKHYVAPKIDHDAFLLARITGWEDLNLVEGPANVYFSGTYVGESYIYTRNVKDTLDLSLGRDNKVLVMRTKLKDFSKTSFIGTKRKETYTYEMVLKNNRKTPIDIEVLDQLPVSQDNEIEVEALELSKAMQNVLTGELRWKFHLEAGAGEKITISFSIKYPKNKDIRIRQSKRMGLPKF